MTAVEDASTILNRKDIQGQTRNIERRHLTPQQRAQIVVEFNAHAGAGNPNLTSPNGEVKTRDQLAKEGEDAERVNCEGEGESTRKRTEWR